MSTMQYKRQPEAAYPCAEPTTKVRFSFSLERFAIIEPARQVRAPTPAANIASLWKQGPSFKFPPQVVKESSTQNAAAPATTPNGMQHRSRTSTELRGIKGWHAR